MKYLILLLLSLLSIDCFSQWTSLNIPRSNRHDDVFFINDLVGWSASGSNRIIYKTTDGGSTWSNQFYAGKYLRSIEFATPTLGFCGSLDSAFYRTTDGGQTWTNIANSISPKPPGICGISAPTPTVIYGVGIWSSPAYIIKSTDGGTTWSSINMASYANALVDVHFISADTGFVSGMSNPTTDGGIILYTTDGGSTWSVKHKTMTNEDYIWKIQTPDGIHYFGSVSGLPTAGNVRMIKSANKGNTWTTSIISNTYSYNQVIGFIDPLKGWSGGGATLFETVDGGLTWNGKSLGGAYNKFLKLNDTTAFLTGNHIYKYQSGIITGNPKVKTTDEVHKVEVFPNPAHEQIYINVKIKNRTNSRMQLFSSDGKLIKTIQDQPLEKGTHRFSVNLNDFPGHFFYFVLQTNEGLIYRKIIKN